MLLVIEVRVLTWLWHKLLFKWNIDFSCAQSDNNSSSYIYDTYESWVDLSSVSITSLIKRQISKGNSFVNALLWSSKLTMQRQVTFRQEVVFLNEE